MGSAPGGALPGAWRAAAVVPLSTVRPGFGRARDVGGGPHRTPGSRRGWRARPRLGGDVEALAPRRLTLARPAATMAGAYRGRRGLPGGRSGLAPGRRSEGPLPGTDVPRGAWVVGREPRGEPPLARAPRHADPPGGCHADRRRDHLGQRAAVP